MKVVWLISGDDSSSAPLQREFDRSGETYLVRHTSKISRIPLEHLQSSATAMLIDSFHVEHTGFEGLKILREMSYQGAIYLFGEPAPEKTTVPFTELGLSGFFPSLERVDLSYVAGIVHHTFFLNAELKLPLLLNSEHKVGTFPVASHEDLEKITQRLSAFGGRFGIKEDLVRKTIMGLCMGHIQTKHGESQISEPFELKFGTDRSKMVISIPTHPKGNDIKVIRQEFAQALANFHSAELKNSVLFQEFHHLVKAVNNLSVIAGSTVNATEYPDPLYLITRIQFHGVHEQDAHLGYYFSIHHSKPNDDMDKDMAQLSLLPDPDSVRPLSQHEMAPAIGAVTSHSEKDLSEILNDPVVVGDVPSVKGEKIALTASENTEGNPTTTGTKKPSSSEILLSEDDVVVNKKYLEKLKIEAQELRASNALLSDDIYRLMKERKEPVIDNELRKQMDELNHKHQMMENEYQAAIKKLQDEHAAPADENPKKDPPKAA